MRARTFISANLSLLTSSSVSEVLPIREKSLMRIAFGPPGLAACGSRACGRFLGLRGVNDCAGKK